MSALHLYAVLAEPPVGSAGGAGAGLGGQPVRLLAAGGLLVAASRVEGRSPSPSPTSPPPAPLSPEVPQVDVAALRAHDAVVRRLAAGTDALLPMRFGQLMPGEDALRAAVERERARLGRALDEVRGCEQFTLRAFGAQGGAESRAEAGAGGQSGVPPGTRYLLGRARERERARTAPPELAPLLERLAPLVRRQHVERPGSGGLLASVYHLVRRADRGPYLERYGAARGEPGVPRVTLSGPWPAYAFAGGPFGDDGLAEAAAASPSVGGAFLDGPSVDGGIP